MEKIPALSLNYPKSRAYQIYSREERRELWRAYYANVSFVDAQVGFLVDSLDRLNLWKNTIVVVHSDHGWQLGEHGGIGNKDVLFRESAQTPLIIAAPGIASGNCTHPVELVDLFPTFASLCKLGPPANLDGVSLEPSLKNPQGPAPRPGAITVVRRHVKGRTGKGFSGQPLTLEKDAGPARQILGRSVRTERWCYIEWDGGELGVELYDMANDPRELNNLADDPASAEAMKKLSELLRELDPSADGQH